MFLEVALLLLLAVLLPADTIRPVVVAPAETLHVVEAGAPSGTPVVLIPGLFGSAFGFRKIVPPLTEAGFHTIIVDPLGIGASARPKDADYSLSAQANRIAAVMDTLGARNAIVVGHSAGGSIAFRIAYRRPDLVGGMVSLEGGPTESTSTTGFRHAMRFAFLLKLVNAVKLVRWQVHRQLLAASVDSSWVTDSAIAGYTAPERKDLGAVLDGYKAIANAREPDSLAPHLPDVHCPVLLLVGTPHHDGGVSSAEVALLARVVPHFTVDTIPNTGHFMFEERPDSVVSAIERMAQEVAAHPGPP